jgi:hypothetical protein
VCKSVPVVAIKTFYLKMIVDLHFKIKLRQAKKPPNIDSFLKIFCPRTKSAGTEQKPVS